MPRALHLIDPRLRLGGDLCAFGRRDMTAAVQLICSRDGQGMIAGMVLGRKHLIVTELGRCRRGRRRRDLVGFGVEPFGELVEIGLHRLLCGWIFSGNGCRKLLRQRLDLCSQ